MSKITIHNNSNNTSDVQCLECVISVMLLGHLADAEDEYVEKTILNHYDKEVIVDYKRVNGVDVFSVADEDLSFRLN